MAGARLCLPSMPDKSTCAASSLLLREAAILAAVTLYCDCESGQAKIQGYKRKNKREKLKRKAVCFSVILLLLSMEYCYGKNTLFNEKNQLKIYVN